MSLDIFGIFLSLELAAEWDVMMLSAHLFVIK